MRYFSPVAEVPFCGHATIALAVALAEKHGPGARNFFTRSGPVMVDTNRDEDGLLRVSPQCPASHLGAG